MSLIHDALKSMDSLSDSGVNLNRASQAPSVVRPTWIIAFLAFFAVIALGLGGWYWWRSVNKTDARQLAVNPVSERLVQKDMPLQQGVLNAVSTQMATHDVTLAANSDSNVVASEERKAVNASMQTLVDAEPSTGTKPNTAPLSVVAASESPKTAQVPKKTEASGHSSVQARPTSPVVAEVPIELVFARFVASMKAQQVDSAKEELAILQSRLPNGSLGLLRAQAWFHLQAGDEILAAEDYRTILERIPGDEEAAINLASLELRNKNSEKARAILDGAARLSPNSASLRAALTQFNPASRQQ